MRQLPLAIFLTTALVMPLAACAPLIFGAAASGAYVGLQDRPVKQTAEDTKLKVLIKDNLAHANASYLTDIGIDVFYGNVLMTGIVPDMASGEQALDLVRRTPGIKKVYNELFVGSTYTATQKAKDAWVSAQIQPRMLISQNAYPLNYLQSVVNGHVYIIGTVSSAEEHDHVLHILRTTRGVQQVHDYLTIENPADLEHEGASASSYSDTAKDPEAKTGTVHIRGKDYPSTQPDPLSDGDMRH